jgi:hypothetical protein
MLGRNSYKQEEIDHAKAAIDQQLAAFRKLSKAVRATSDPKATSALDAFEPLFFGHLTLALDRYFVHRIRPVAGKDCNPLNEVELLSESLLTDGGVFRGNKVIKLKPDETVLKLEPGDPIALNAEQFDRLAGAFFAELESRFGTA